MSGGKRSHKEKKNKKKRKHSESDSDSEEHHKKNRKRDRKENTDVPEIKPLSEGDYFIRVNEFSVWLTQHRRLRFEDLSSKEAHKQFEKFCKEWNSGKLDSMYYSCSIPPEIISEAVRTKHNWNFTKKLTQKEKHELSMTTDTIKSATSTGEARKISRDEESVSARPSVIPRGSTHAPREDFHRGGLKDILEDIAPKATGRQAQLDKRRTVGTATHGSAKDREYMMDGLDLNEKDTFGGSEDIQRLTAKSKEARSRRSEAEYERVQIANRKEAERREAFMAQMGLDPGKKITIKPRSNEH